MGAEGRAVLRGSGGWDLGWGRSRIRDMERGRAGRGFKGQALRSGSWIGVLTQHHCLGDSGKILSLPGRHPAHWTVPATEGSCCISTMSGEGCL